jgi:hypothetical protein
LSKKAAEARSKVPLPAIRNKVEVEQLKQKKNGKQTKPNTAPKDEKELKRDITPMFDYYKAWDKYAADEE